jgi:hypothetical protein
MSDIKSSMVNEKKKEQKEQKEDWVVGVIVRWATQQPNLLFVLFVLFSSHLPLNF